MEARSFKELYNELIKVDFIETDKNVVTGEECEDWIKEEFRRRVDNGL